MSKKRTRKNKEKARHQFLVSWSPATNKASNNSSVNRQLGTRVSKLTKAKSIVKNANLSDQDESLGRAKKEIIRSLILSSLILAGEVVLYLAWSR